MSAEFDYLRSIHGSLPSIAALMLRFNFHPADYLHIERRRELLPELPDSVWSFQRLHGRLSGKILREAGLLERPVFIHPFWGWPLALLPPDRLHRLALHLGALVQGVRIRASLSREHVLSWKSKLGSEAYHFSMTRASLLPPLKEMGLDLLSLEPDQCGFLLLQSAARDMPDAMRLRFFWKMPRHDSESAMNPVQARKLVRQVFSIVEPEWHSSSLPIAQEAVLTARKR